jgi:hypothetical protein
MATASTVSTLQSFPGKNSIPPACFYNTGGLAQWLNLHPSYKIDFATTGLFPYLIPSTFVTSSLSSLGYNPENVPLCSNVQLMSMNQAFKYKNQLHLFQKIYAHNSNAFIEYVSTGIGPVYYNFLTNQERSDYKSAVALVNKLYSFDAMAQAEGWNIPFPI